MSVTTKRRPRVVSAMIGAGALAASVIGFTCSPSPAQAAATGRPELGIAAGGTLQFQTAAQQETYLTAAQDLGATWLRFDFTWNDIQRSNASTFDWARYDALVARASAHHLKVLGMIGYPPAWARDPKCSGDQFCRPKDPAAYGRFAGQVAARYAPQGVHHWELWNEQNTDAFFKPVADAGYYTAMLKSAYPAIHAADPQAKVITGGTAPAPSSGGNVSPTDFVKGMYTSGAAGSFDILGHHPYCYAGSFDCPGTDAGWSAWSQMSVTPTNLRGLMTANGDGGKQIWGTEFGAPTAGDSSAVTEAHQSGMLRDGIARFATYSWSGPLFLYSLQDRGTNTGTKEDWFGVLRANGTRKQSFATLQTALRSAAPAPTIPAPTATVPVPPVPTVPRVPVTTPPPVSMTVPAPAPATTPPAPPHQVTPPPADPWSSFWLWVRHRWF